MKVTLKNTIIFSNRAYYSYRWKRDWSWPCFKLSLLFPITLYSTYGVLQCNKFGRKTKETLTGFYKQSLCLVLMQPFLLYYVNQVDFFHKLAFFKHKLFPKVKERGLYQNKVNLNLTFTVLSTLLDNQGDSRFCTVSPGLQIRV